MASGKQLGRNPLVLNVAWKPPPEGCVKINVDGSYISVTGSSACGGIAKDLARRLVRGFYSKVGLCNAVWAKL